MKKQSHLKKFSFSAILLLPFLSHCGAGRRVVNELPKTSASSTPNSSSPSRLICVTTAGFYRVQVFDPTLSGVVTAYRSFGDLTSLSDPNLYATTPAPDAIAVDATNDEIFVANSATNSINVYKRTSFGTGNMAPSRTLVGSNTGLNVPNGIAINSTTDELVVTNWGNNSVTFYSRKASSNTAPTRTLTGSNTTLSNPIGIALDTSGDMLWVANNTGGMGSITSFPYPSTSTTGNMNTAPDATITASIDSPTGIAIDNVTSPGFVWVANQGSGDVTVYKLSDGTLSHTKTLGLNPAGITVDTANNQFIVSSDSGATNSALSVYPLAYDNTAALAFSLKGGATRLRTPTGVAVDMTHSEYLTINTETGNLSVGIFSLAETADGTAHATAPTRSISSLYTRFALPGGIAVDLTNKRIAIANQNDGADSIAVYTLSSSGNATPTFTIVGGSTQLDKPVGVALDSTNIYVANYGTGASTGSITVYPISGSDGDVAPTSTIDTPANGIDHPTGIALDANLVNNSNYLYVANAASNEITAYPAWTGAYAAGAPDTIATNLNAPSGIFVDTSATAASSHNEVFVTNGDNSISIFDISSGNFGNLQRIITGAGTLINNPTGITVDATNNEIMVANAGGNSILAFSRTDGSTTAATQNVPPLRTLSQTNMGMYYPTGVALCQ